MISTLCVANVEFQLLNPTSQLSLVARCSSNCCTKRGNLTWNIYQGSTNLSAENVIHWTPFNPTNLDHFFGQCFFSPPVLTDLCSSPLGMNRSHFTADQELFSSNPSITLWRFEVVYSTPSERSVSALNFEINSPPRNGSCSISPLNGSTLTPFTVSCFNWFDEDQIKDYSLLSLSFPKYCSSLNIYSFR